MKHWDACVYLKCNLIKNFFHHPSHFRIFCIHNVFLLLTGLNLRAFKVSGNFLARSLLSLTRLPSWRLCYVAESCRPKFIITGMAGNWQSFLTSMSHSILAIMMMLLELMEIKLRGDITACSIPYTLEGAKNIFNFRIFLGMKAKVFKFFSTLREKDNGKRWRERSKEKSFQSVIGWFWWKLNEISFAVFHYFLDECKFFFTYQTRVKWHNWNDEE